MAIRLALKVDADTDRGTREGVPNLAADCRDFGVPACFLFSLGTSPMDYGRVPPYCLSAICDPVPVALSMAFQGPVCAAAFTLLFP